MKGFTHIKLDISNPSKDKIIWKAETSDEAWEVFKKLLTSFEDIHIEIDYKNCVTVMGVLAQSAYNYIIENKP